MQPFWPQGCLLSGENATLALNHLAHTCCTSLWEVFPHDTSPDPRRWPSFGVSLLWLRAGALLCHFFLLWLEDQRVYCLQPVLVCQSNPGKKRKVTPTVGCSVTYWHLLKHLDSWIPSRPWEVLCNQSHSSVINATPLRKSTHGKEKKRWGGFIDIHLLTYKALLLRFKAPKIYFDGAQMQCSHTYVCTEMSWKVCDWSPKHVAPREDTGRGQTRLFQIDMSGPALGRPNWLDKGNAFCLSYLFISLKQLPLFYCE